jgi:hypothetical protein
MPQAFPAAALNVIVERRAIGNCSHWNFFGMQQQATRGQLALPGSLRACDHFPGSLNIWFFPGHGSWSGLGNSN